MKELLSVMLQNEVQNDFRVNLEQIDSLLNEELTARNFAVPHFLNVINSTNDSLIYSTSKYASDTTNSLQSRSIPLGILKKQYIKAQVPNQQQVILKRMGWGVSAALFLILIVISCFIYMLSTIFRQKQLSEIKNDFINNMTHELKTPIATVAAAIEAMQNFGVLDDKKKTQQYLELSSLELVNLSGLVEKVLHMAIQEKRMPELTPEIINVKDLCNNIIRTQKVKLGNRSLQYTFNAHHGNEQVKADRFHFLNIMQNLIDNALKYSYEKMEIIIECKKEDGWNKISISDKGIGISKKHQSNIFNQFYRVPTGDIHNVKGFGLGLNYVKTTLQAHGGAITVKSTPGAGSVFTILLPAE